MCIRDRVNAEYMGTQKIFSLQMELETRKSHRQVQSKKYNEYYTFSLSRNNEFDQAINESLKNRTEDFDIPAVRSKKRIHYSNYFGDSDSDNDDGDWRNNKKKMKKRKRRSGKKNQKFRERKIKQKEIVSEIEQLLKWRSLIEYQDQPLPLNCYSMHLEDSISDLNLDKYAYQAQAILMTPQWKTPENPTGNFTLEDLQKIQISKKVMKNGIIWLWAEKEYLSEIISIMAKKNFTYIENVNIIQLNAEKSAEYLNQEQRMIIDNEMNKQLDQQKKIKEALHLTNIVNGNTSSEEQSTKEELQQHHQPSKLNENGIEEWTDEIDLISEQLEKDFNVKALDVLDEKKKETVILNNAGRQYQCLGDLIRRISFWS
eukprot:TRINITY_DN1595_c0_g1_i2.p1 TRINITY_DN1595_c0_g1~~TRINITY_DN1595_c0_g1_i2.p1  ORF type:complete len:372 (-),score=79.59 TRINITY_DN1595_c0_g1_i2:523-1638(-)